MKRHIILIILLSAIHQNAMARDRFHIGLEWGGCVTAASFHHFNYMDETVGFRIDDRGWVAGPALNGYASLVLGMDISGRVNLSFTGGVAGYPGGRRAVPLALRLSVMPNGVSSDGFFWFAEPGYAPVWHPVRADSFVARLGSGYRLALDSHSSLDFHLCIRGTFDHPQVWDELEEKYINKRNIRRNNALYCAPEFGISLSF